MITTVLSRYATPPCALMLGLDILEASTSSRTVLVRFEAKAEFCNASGNIQGGLLTAMLDDSMGPAVLIATNAAFMPVTITLNVTFLAAAKPGVIFGRGFARRLGKTMGHVEGSLESEKGLELARATASVRLIPFQL